MRRHCEESQARAVFWLKTDFKSWAVRLIQTYAGGLSVDPKVPGNRVWEFTLTCKEKGSYGDEVYDYTVVRFCMQRSFEDWLPAEKKAQGL
jgi:hypothetical protein